jgi:hypothetical protein
LFTTTRYHKAIWLNVTTYESMNSKGEQLVNLIQKILNNFTTYLTRSLEINIELMNGKEKTLKFNEKNLNKVFELLLAGEIETLLIGDEVKDSGKRYADDPVEIKDYPTHFSFAICCNQAATYPPHFSKNLLFTNDFNLSLSEQLFNNHIPLHIQQSFIELFKEAIVAINGVSGFITCESFSAGSPASTAYENYYAINSQRPPGVNQRARGYFWNNYLSKDHIEQLGGVEQVLSNAPCSVIELLSTPIQQGILLQLTDDINSYSDEQLFELRKYLLNLLELANKYEIYGGEKRNFNFFPAMIVRLVEP